MIERGLHLGRGDGWVRELTLLDIVEGRVRRRPDALLPAWLAVAIAVVACSESRAQVAKVPRNATAESALIGSDTACRLVVRQAPSGRFARELSALERLLDASRLMVWRDQARYAGRYAGRAVPGSFPGVPYKAVKAFAYRFARSSTLDGALPGCTEQVLSDDGRLCPSVVASGVSLDEAQVAQLLHLVNAPKSRWALGCIFDPHHAFVFYDDTGAPVADIQVCFGCGEWSLSGGDSITLPTGVYSKLAKLCSDLQLGGCPVAEDEENAYFSSYRQWVKSGALARPSTMLSISPSRKLASMNDVEKRRLCAWRAVELGDVRELDEDLGRDWDRPRSFRLQSFQQCVDRFPRCQATLGEVEQADLRRDSSANFAMPESCVAAWVFGNLGECLWGIERD